MLALLASAPPLEQNEEQTATNEATTNVKDKGKNEDEEENLCVICLSDPKVRDFSICTPLP